MKGERGKNILKTIIGHLTTVMFLSSLALFVVSLIFASLVGILLSAFFLTAGILGSLIYNDMSKKEMIRNWIKNGKEKMMVKTAPPRLKSGAN